MPDSTADANGQLVPMVGTSPPFLKDQGAAERKSRSVAPLIVHRDKSSENEAAQRKAGKTTGRDANSEAFTISTRDKEKWERDLPPPCFRVEPADSGFRVRLDYYDRAGKRRRPYCCYLNAKEREALKKKSFEDAAPTVLLKVRERRPKTDEEREKIAAIIALLERLS